MRTRIISALRVLFIKKVIVVETFPDGETEMPMMTMWSSMKDPQEVIKLLREVTARYDQTVREELLRKLEA